MFILLYVRQCFNRFIDAKTGKRLERNEASTILSME